MWWDNKLHYEKSWVIFKRAAEHQSLIQINERACASSNRKIRLYGPHAYYEYGKADLAQSRWRGLELGFWWKVFNWFIYFRYFIALGIHKLNGYILFKELLGKIVHSHTDIWRMENEKAIQYLVPYLEIVHSLERIRWDDICWRG